MFPYRLQNRLSDLNEMPSGSGGIVVKKMLDYLIGRL